MTHGRIGVLGAGGHGKVVVRLLQELGYEVGAIFDDDRRLAGSQLFGVPVVGPIAEAEGADLAGAVIAVGDNAARKSLAERLELPWLTLVHPQSFVDATAHLGRGTVVLAGAVIQASAELGEHVIINTAASVDHDCRLGDYAHVAPGAHLAGEVCVAEGGFLGTGAAAIPGARIGAWSIVGAGAVVIDELASWQVAVGIPARAKRPVACHSSWRNGARNAVSTAPPADFDPASRSAKPADAAAAEASRVYLSPPHMSGTEWELLREAFDSNWIAPLGPQVDAFEREFAERVGVKHAVALSSGTAALHLALLLAGVESGDTVAISTLTFAAPANAIRYAGARPWFIDSELHSWNMDPVQLAEALKEAAGRGCCPKAVVVVDAFGQCADYTALREICRFYEVPLVEDAAEALGATYRDRQAGSFGEIGCFSFNGNKIITASGGGMLVTDREDWARRARYLATQAKLPAPHYEHSEVGYNYRLSNLLAAVGRGQLRVLDDRVARRRANFDNYRASLNDLPGLSFMPELAQGRSTRWLSCLLVDPQKFGASREDIQEALAKRNVESRPVWKPMHQQPAYQEYPVQGGEVAEALFHQGLCLPSGSNLTEADRQRVVATIRETAGRACACGSSSRVAPPNCLLNG